MVTTPTARSLKHLKKQGWQVCVVERYISFCKQRFDAFSFGDLLGYFPGNQTVGPCIALIQVTSASNVAARRKKILASEHYKGWKDCGGWILLMGWSKRGKLKRWEPTMEWL